MDRALVRVRRKEGGNLMEDVRKESVIQKRFIEEDSTQLLTLFR